MKQFIVLMAMIALGLFIYACVSGPGDSILTALKSLWRFEIASGPYSTWAASLSLLPGSEGPVAIQLPILALSKGGPV